MAKATKNGSSSAKKGKNKGVELPENTVLIKKYPNRRLYNTKTSAYIVLEDIVDLIQSDTEFVIQDTKTGEDITRSILNQIIFEQEVRPGQHHFPLEFQKQLISMYGDTYGAMVPDYLTKSLELFVTERSRMSEAMEGVVGRNTQMMMEFSQNMARQNMELFKRSWEMFGGMSGQKSADQPSSSEDEGQVDAKHGNESDQTAREAELEEIQKKIDALQGRLKSLK